MGIAKLLVGKRQAKIERKEGLIAIYEVFQPLIFNTPSYQGQPYKFLDKKIKL